MKKYFLIFLFLFMGIKANGQNQGTNLYLIFNPNEPNITKDIHKYLRRSDRISRMQECGVSKLTGGTYFIQYPVYYGLDLELTPKQGATMQTINISQVASLYPQARTAAQLDMDMQPSIDYDYNHPIRNQRRLFDAKTISYLRSFDKIFVIEYLPNGTAKVVECDITSRH